MTFFIKCNGNNQASTLSIYFLRLIFMRESLKLIIAVFDLLLGSFELWLLGYCWLLTYTTEISALIMLCTFLHKKQIISKLRRCWFIFFSFNFAINFVILIYNHFIKRFFSVQLTKLDSNCRNTVVFYNPFLIYFRKVSSKFYINVASESRYIFDKFILMKFLVNRSLEIKLDRNVIGYKYWGIFSISFTRIIDVL